MKKLFFITIAAITLYACNSTPSSYTVTGKVNQTDLEGSQVLLTLTENRETTTVDSAVIANGEFEFKGAVETPKIYTILINREEKPVRVGFVLENAKIAVTIDENGTKISGTPTNEAFQQYQDQTTESNNQKKGIFDEYKELKEAGTLTQEIEDSLSNILDKIDSEQTETAKAFATANINNPAGQSAFRGLSYRLSVEEQKAIIAGADSAALQTDILKLITQRIDALERTAVGQKFTDLRFPNPDGVEIALSDYVGKNKAVLVDFWASWCGPCRRDMPNVVEAYKKYKNKGFEVVGVSLDKTKEEWVKGIKDLGITWPQMSDIKYWDSEAAKIYAVNSIPHMMLIDGEGTIIARGIHGSDLDAMLKDLLK